VSGLKLIDANSFIASIEEFVFNIIDNYFKNINNFLESESDVVYAPHVCTYFIHCGMNSKTMPGFPATIVWTPDRDEIGIIF